MPLLNLIPLDRLSPSRLWAHVDAETRLEAARALYAHDWSDGAPRHEADASIALGMRFREATVRQLPVERRAAYLARNVSPNDSLASSLLLALHLEHRRPLLSAFLDALGIPHDDGVIAEADGVDPPEAGRLREATAGLGLKFARAHLDLYIASLLAIDPVTWGGLAEIAAERARQVESP